MKIIIAKRPRTSSKIITNKKKGDVTIQNKNINELDILIKKYNKKDNTQKKITDSLDNRNFTGYADSNKNKDAKTVIYNAINA